MFKPNYMLNHNTFEVNDNDREQRARGLGLSLKRFDELVNSANSAYEILRDLGPFYGREDVKDPTFRVTAEPVFLPKKSKKQFELLGSDLLAVGKALLNLPETYRDKLSEKVDYRIPPTWRIDAILDENGEIKMNELEGVDSASALMVAEQLAYNLQTLDKSTAALLVSTIKSMVKVHHRGKKYKIAVIRAYLEGNPHTSNAKRFAALLEKLSGGNLRIDLLDGEKLRSGKVKPNWNKYHGVINETILSSRALSRLGIRTKLLLSSGNFNAIGNKGVFALIFDKKLKTFWEKEIGGDRLERLQEILIPTRFIETERDLKAARKAGKVVKVSWANNMILLNRSKGVAIPEGDIEQSSNERWEQLRELLNEGVKLIAQDYVRPAKLKAFLRKKGTTLEPVEWYNRVCVKYVVQGNPNEENTNEVNSTAIEITLGPDVIPAGRACAFTAGTFQE